MGPKRGGKLQLLGRQGRRRDPIREIDPFSRVPLPSNPSSQASMSMTDLHAYHGRGCVYFASHYTWKHVCLPCLSFSAICSAFWHPRVRESRHRHLVMCAINGSRSDGGRARATVRTRRRFCRFFRLCAACHRPPAKRAPKNLGLRKRASPRLLVAEPETPLAAWP